MADERSERPVVLAEWVVRYLTENAFGQYTVAEAVLGGAHGAEEMEAARLIVEALQPRALQPREPAEEIATMIRLRLGHGGANFPGAAALYDAAADIEHWYATRGGGAS